MIILRHWDRNEGHVLASDYPELAEQWNYDRNDALTPWDVTIGSGKKVWWKCSLGHEWEATIGSRTYQSNGCPYCAGKKAWPGFNDLASQRPDLAAEWNDKKNGTLTPQMVTIGSNRKVWWKCSLGHEWEAAVSSRARKAYGCPYCAGRKAWPGFNDLATLRPDIAAEWNDKKNGTLTPQMVTAGSRRKIWWRCPLGHEWEAVINARTGKSNGCPYCAGLYAWPGFNDLATKRPDVAADWDYELNGTNLPVQYTAYSSKKVWWVCRRGHPSYLMAIFNRSNGQGCPKCGYKKIAVANSTKVFCYDPDGRLQGAYPSILTAARETGRHRATVRRLSAGKSTPKNGYLYRYADQQPVKEPSSTGEGRLKDCLSQSVSVGDPVMFIRAKENKKAVLIRGKVSGITEHSAYIQPENGSGSRLFVPGDDPEFLPKALVLHRRPERALEGALDASGYPVREGDPVVYILPHVYRDCRQFLYGTAVQADNSSWTIDGVKIPAGNMVVVNWE